MPYLSALEVWSWQGAIQIHVCFYLTLPWHQALSWHSADRYSSARLVQWFERESRGKLKKLFQCQTYISLRTGVMCVCIVYVCSHWFESCVCSDCCWLSVVSRSSAAYSVSRWCWLFLRIFPESHQFTARRSYFSQCQHASCVPVWWWVVLVMFD